MSELRLRSPFLAHAAGTFVDGGSVWERGQGGILASPSLRITPGFGFGVATPLGPGPAPISLHNETTGLRSAHRSSLTTGALDKIAHRYTNGTSNSTFQFAIGQPF